MEAYLGETLITDPFLTGTPYRNFSPIQWALEYINHYGQVDGGHHKAWVLDQVVRILLGTLVEVKLARWSNGQEEYRFSTGTPSDAYKAWVEQQQGEVDPETGEREYDYDCGIAP